MSNRSPYTEVSERARQLARSGIHDRSGDQARGIDDSISSHDGDEEQPIGEDISEHSFQEDDRVSKRTRSQSRERWSAIYSRGHIPEANWDDSGPSTLRQRPLERPRTPEVQDQPLPPYSPGQPAVYADDSPNWLLIGLIIGAMAILLLVFICFLSSSPTSDVKIQAPKKSMEEIFANEMKQFQKSSFANQRSRLWSTIRSAIKPVLNRSETIKSIGEEAYLEKSAGERSPAVILLVSDARDQASLAAALCLATKLANITSATFANGMDYRQGYLDVDGQQLPKQDVVGSVDGKKLLETKLNGYLEMKGSNPVIVLRNIHRLSSEAALILHAFCDNENAPRREAVYLLTVECGRDQRINSTSIDGEPEPTPISVSDTGENDWDGVAEACLRSEWLERGQLSVDKIAPVLSRIANNVVFVQSESKVDC